MNCWRLTKERTLVQDVPLAPGVRVYYLSEDRTITERRVLACQRDGRWRAYSPEISDRAHPFARAERCIATRLTYAADRTYLSREAATSACQLTMSDGESSSFWARIEGRHDDNEGCWKWVGETARNGTGIFHWRDWSYPPHEVAYNLRRPLFRTGWITHTCGEILCCNYRHMERR